jgi:HEAT repeat protein
MLEAYLIALYALGTGVYTALMARSNRRLLREWMAAAESLGLRVEETTGFWGGNLMLRAREKQIQVRISASLRRDHGPEIRIAGPWPQDFSSVWIRPERDKPPGAREIEIGDEPFDQAFYVVGPAQLLFALLNAETRRLMAAFPESSSLHIGAVLTAEIGPLGIADTLGLLLPIARRLAQPLNIAERLAENARGDVNAEVRLRNLLLLVRERPGETVTAEALRAACADPSPKVRLRAAKVLGHETHGLLAELAESPEDDEASAQAVTILGRGLPVERTRAILVQALRRRLLQTARACLEALAGSGTPEDIDILAKVLAREKSDLAAAAAQALAAAGNPAAEPPLLAALQHKRPDVRVAAAKALGRAGTAAAVLPLKETAEQTSNQVFRRAARQSIAEIQSRLQGASPGQLSLTGDEPGRLSLATAEAGDLSLADEQGGQLSLPAEDSEV